MEDTEVLIIGGGVAGLTAALYLARYRRRVVVVTTARSRARWIPTSHNIPGFTNGVAGTTFLNNLEQQAAQLGVDIRTGEVLSLRRLSDKFTLEINSSLLIAPFALVATGVVDVLPDIQGAEAAVRRGLFRLCPICDGFEARGERIAVLGSGAHAVREAKFLKTYSPDVTLLAIDSLEQGVVDNCENAGISVIHVPLDTVSLGDREITVTRQNGVAIKYDTLYLALGCTPQIQFLDRLGVKLDDRHALVVDEHQQTSIDGLYGAGDVVRGLNQIIVAAAEGAIAATAIHNRLIADGEPR